MARGVCGVRRGCEAWGVRRVRCSCSNIDLKIVGIAVEHLVIVQVFLTNPAEVHGEASSGQSDVVPGGIITP